MFQLKPEVQGWMDIQSCLTLGYNGRIRQLCLNIQWGILFEFAVPAFCWPRFLQCFLRLAEVSAVGIRCCGRLLHLAWQQASSWPWAGSDLGLSRSAERDAWHAILLFKTLNFKDFKSKAKCCILHNSACHLLSAAANTFVAFSVPGFIVLELIICVWRPRWSHGLIRKLFTILPDSYKDLLENQ